LLLGGLEQDWIMTFQKQLGMESSSQLTNSIIFHRGRAQPPTRNHGEQKKQVGFPFENEEFQVSWSFPIFAPMFGAKRSTRTTSGFAGSDFVPPIWFI
jgi:hypothetical protein